MNCQRCGRLYEGDAAEVVSLLCELSHDTPPELQQGLLKEGWIHSLATYQMKLVA